MSTPALASNYQRRHGDDKTEVIRRTAGYHPSVWGDYFINCTPGDTKSNLEAESRAKELKGEIRMVLSKAKDNPLEELILIDAVQRLGLAYHFEDEMEAAIKSIHNTPINCETDDGEADINISLHAVALRFRLLRQQGYRVSSDVFRKFKDEKGEFKSMLKENAKSLLCLYEASHFAVHGEEILEEALEFSSKNLQSMLPQLNSPLKEQVKLSLEVSLLKKMPRLEARHHIHVYQPDVAQHGALLELAKLDFYQLQTLHQRELSNISKWWKETNVPSKLPFVRDRLVECYFWILGIYFEPKYSMIRSFMTKVIISTSVIDDIYDLYGTLEELKLFTDLIQRWDLAAVTDLPEYMQVCFETLFDAVKEMEEKLILEGRSYCIYYAKEAIKGLVSAYFREAIWFNTNYIPTFEEHLSVSVISSTYPMLIVQSLIGLGEIATKDVFDWIFNIPKIVKSCALIARLVDDIHTHKEEQERGDAPSAVECYMKEHGVSEEEACGKLKEMVVTAWKDINEELLNNPNRHPLPILAPALNLARMIEIVFEYGSGYTNSTGRTKDIIKSLFVDPIYV